MPYLINNYVIQTFKICTCFLLSLGFQPCRWCVGGCGEWVYLCLCVFICTLMARTQTPSALIRKCSDTELNPSLELISLFFFFKYVCAAVFLSRVWVPKEARRDVSWTYWASHPTWGLRQTGGAGGILNHFAILAPESGFVKVLWFHLGVPNCTSLLKLNHFSIKLS